MAQTKIAGLFLDPTVISGLTAITDGAPAVDYLFVWDAGTSTLKKILPNHLGLAAAAHTIESHDATSATGVNLETLTNAGDADALHTHALKASLAAPALTGDATATTQAGTDYSTKIATTAHVKDVKIDDFTAGDDNTTLDSSTSRHGLLLKLGGGTTNFLRADGSWAAAGGGIASVVADTTPQLGGNLDMQARLLVGNGGSTGIAISANGEVTMAAQPCVLAYNSATDSNVTGAGTLTTIDFDTEVFDQNGDFASDAFTAPIAGRYGFFVNVRVDGVTSSMNASAFNIVASNRTFATERGHGEDSNGRVNMWISAIVDMDAADTLTITVQNSGESGDVHDIAGDSNPRTFISVVKVA